MWSALRRRSSGLLRLLLRVVLHLRWGLLWELEHALCTALEEADRTPPRRAQLTQFPKAQATANRQSERPEPDAPDSRGNRDEAEDPVSEPPLKR
jgi:hypothetical protein